MHAFISIGILNNDVGMSGYAGDDEGALVEEKNAAVDAMFGDTRPEKRDADFR